MKLGAFGELLPERGFSRRGKSRPESHSAWVSHDGLVVLSAVEVSHLPGSGEPAKLGPQWHVSVSRRTGGTNARCRATNADLVRVASAFDLPTFDEDNHHPGIARHLWCPIADEYRHACECKLTERTVVDPSGYTWTTETDGPCRGCAYARMSALPCPVHP